MDVCEACWQNQFSDGARQRKGFISHWQSVYEAPAPPVDPIHAKPPRPCCESSSSKTTRVTRPPMFILAVMLERKRVFKVKEQIVRDGKRVFIYEQPGTGDVFTIADPDLRLDQLEQVQRDVAALLEHGLNPPAPAGENPASGVEQTSAVEAPTGGTTA